MLTLTEKPRGKEKNHHKPQGCHFLSQNRKNVPYVEKEGGEKVGGGEHKVVNLLGRPCQLSAKGHEI